MVLAEAFERLRSASRCRRAANLARGFQGRESVFLGVHGKSLEIKPRAWVSEDGLARLGAEALQRRAAQLLSLSGIACKLQFMDSIGLYLGWTWNSI